MNASLKNDILVSYRAGSSMADISRAFGISIVQVEKVVFPNGNKKKILPVVLPKVAKDITTLFGADSVIRIPNKIQTFVPKAKSTVIVAPPQPPKNIVSKPGSTKSVAKSSKGRLAALQAWETIREQRAQRKGEVYIRKSEEELRKLAGIVDQAADELRVTVKPEALKARQEELAKREPPIFLVEEKKEEELDIDVKSVVEIGRAVSAYCSEHKITLKELLDSHQQLTVITKLLSKNT